MCDGVWLRNDLETFQKRLKYIEARMAQDGLVLTDAQLNAFEKAKEEKKVHGEIETHHPGYLGAQDTTWDPSKELEGSISKHSLTHIAK